MTVVSNHSIIQTARGNHAEARYPVAGNIYTRQMFHNAQSYDPAMLRSTNVFFLPAPPTSDGNPNISIIFKYQT